MKLEMSCTVCNSRLVICCHIVHSAILPYCMPTSHLITGSRNLALVLSGSLLLSSLVTIALCSALAGLASLTFLHLGSELKAKTVGTVSCFSICLNGSNPIKVYEKENVSTKWSLPTRTLHSYIWGSTSRSFYSH